MKAKKSVEISENSMSTYVVRAFALAGLALFASNALAQSDDATVNQRLAGFPGFDATVGSNGDSLIDRIGSPNTKCNSPTANQFEATCPPDITFLPFEDTNGKSAYAVGMVRYEVQEIFPECYIVPSYEYDPGSDLYEIRWVIDCFPSGETVFVFIYGKAVMANTWGTLASSESQVNDNISTFAYKSTDLVPCNIVFQNPNVFCGNASDGVYVEDSGVEVETIVEDPGCDLAFGIRLDVGSQASAGCLVPAGGFVSNLPQPYIDTTIGDDAAFFQASVGSAAANQIVEGFKYVTEIGFYSLEPQSFPTNFVGLETRHAVGITNEQTAGIGCSPTTPWFCFFGVDQNTLHRESF